MTEVTIKEFERLISGVVNRNILLKKALNNEEPYKDIPQPAVDIIVKNIQKEINSLHLEIGKNIISIFENDYKIEGDTRPGLYMKNGINVPNLV